MEVKRTISLCIPSYNRVSMTLESFSNVYHDERISEIVVVDDASDWGVFMELKEVLDDFPKVKLYRNLSNQDCYRNKATSIGFSTNKWCILLDSDNIIDADYLDKIFAIERWDERTIYTPEFAAPNFNFADYAGLLITEENVAQYIDRPLFETCLNAANYFVNKTEYLEVWDGSVDPVTSDSIFQCYNWLRAGNKIQIVPGLTYQHRVHPGSHYQNEKHRTPSGFHESVLNKIRGLK